MKCNTCWKDLENGAVATTCGHIFCSEDAEKISSSADATCPLCEQMLSKSNMKTVDVAPTDEWLNIKVMKSAFKGVIFWIGQKDVEVQLSLSKAVQFRQKCEQMQAAYSQKICEVEEAYSSKLQQVHLGYQKAIKKIQGMEQERETVLKDKKEIQEKYTEKSRQKRKLEEMYDALRKEHELLKRSVASSTPNNQVVVQRANPYAFAPTVKGFDDLRHQPPGLSGMPSKSQGGAADFWPPRQEAQPGPSQDIPSLPGRTLRSRRQGSVTSLAQPMSGGTSNMFNANHHSPFNTSAAQRSDSFRSLLRSPNAKRHESLGPRGL